jgi:hypothetical protein
MIVSLRETSRAQKFDVNNSKSFQGKVRPNLTSAMVLAPDDGASRTISCEIATEKM